MSNGKRYGLSDSLLDAVRSVVSSDKPLESNEDKWKKGFVEEKKEVETLDEKLSSKEKMKRGLYNSKKMDPVGKADADIDNDGDVDDSDEYLHKRRKAIKKAMQKEGIHDTHHYDPKHYHPKDKHYGSGPDLDPESHDLIHGKDGPIHHMNKKGYKVNHVSPAGRHTDMDGEPTKAHKNPDITVHHDHEHGAHGYTVHHNGAAANDSKLHHASLHNRLNEAAGSRSQDKQAGETAPVKQGASDIHKCAKQVAHEEWGAGETIHGEHGDWDEEGNVPWYDVIFEHGIEKQVPASDLEVITEKHHGHMKKKDK